MIDELIEAAPRSTVPEGGRGLAQTCPIEVEILQPFVPRPPKEIERGALANTVGPSVTAPPRANRSEAAPRIDKPDEFAGILPVQVHRERPGGRVRTLLVAVLQATAADLGRGGERRTEALRWICYRRLPEDRNLGFTLGEICERLDLDVQWTRARLVAIEVDPGGASRRGRRAETVPLCPRPSEKDELRD